MRDPERYKGFNALLLPPLRFQYVLPRDRALQRWASLRHVPTNGGTRRRNGSFAKTPHESAKIVDNTGNSGDGLDCAAHGLRVLADKHFSDVAGHAFV